MTTCPNCGLCLPSPVGPYCPRCGMNLAEYAAHHPSSTPPPPRVPPPPPPPTPSPVGEPLPLPPPASTRPARPKRRAALAIGVIAVLVIGTGLGAWAVLRGSSEDPAPEATRPLDGVGIIDDLPDAPRPDWTVDPTSIEASECADEECTLVPLWNQNGDELLVQSMGTSSTRLARVSRGDGSLQWSLELPSRKPPVACGPIVDGRTVCLANSNDASTLTHVSVADGAHQTISWTRPRWPFPSGKHAKDWTADQAALPLADGAIILERLNRGARDAKTIPSRLVAIRVGLDGEEVWRTEIDADTIPSESGLVTLSADRLGENVFVSRTTSKGGHAIVFRVEDGQVVRDAAPGYYLAQYAGQPTYGLRSEEETQILYQGRLLPGVPRDVTPRDTSAGLPLLTSKPWGEPNTDQKVVAYDREHPDSPRWTRDRAELTAYCGGVVIVNQNESTGEPGPGDLPGAGTYRLIGLDPTTGKEKWRAATTTERPSGGAWCDGSRLITITSGLVTATDLTSGRFAWRTRVTTRKGAVDWAAPARTERGTGLVAGDGERLVHLAPAD